MPDAKTEILKLRVAPGHLDAFKRAAETERMTLSEWVRRLALLRVAELGERVRDGDNNQ